MAPPRGRFGASFCVLDRLCRGRRTVLLVAVRCDPRQVTELGAVLAVNTTVVSGDCGHDSAQRLLATRAARAVALASRVHTQDGPQFGGRDVDGHRRADVLVGFLPVREYRRRRSNATALRKKVDIAPPPVSFQTKKKLRAERRRRR